MDHTEEYPQRLRQRIPVARHIGAECLRIPADTELVRLEGFPQRVQQHPVATQQTDPHIVETFGQDRTEPGHQLEHIEIPQCHRGRAPGAGVAGTGDRGPVCGDVRGGRGPRFDEQR